MPGLWEEVHGHCFNGTEGGSFHSVGRGPAKAWWERGGRRMAWTHHCIVHHCYSSKRGVSSPNLSSMIGLFTPLIFPLLLVYWVIQFPACCAAAVSWLWGQLNLNEYGLKIQRRSPSRRSAYFSSCHIYLVNLMQEILTPQSYSLQLWDCRTHRWASSAVQLF